jgi:hypothetical protein
MYKSIFLQYVNLDITPNIVPHIISYGEKTGSFLTNEYTLTKYSLNNYHRTKYCFVPIKTEYYMLMWDLDYKILKHPELFDFKDKFDDITQYIIHYICESINELFINPDITYIYADKNIGAGVHLYFPNIIINKKVHAYLFNHIMQKMIKHNMYPENILNIVFDACISKANGLRMFYYYLKDNFYKPNKDLSTFDFDDNPELHFKYCLINTDNKEISPKINIDMIIIDTFVFKIDKKNKESDIKNNIIKEDIEYINDFTYLKLDDKKEMFIELTNLLNIKRIDDYDNWIKLVCLFKTYGLYTEIIELSKKSSKFNIDSIKHINNIFKKKRMSAKMLTIGSLIKWVSEDNFNNTVKILEKYNVYLKLNIKNVDEILLTHNINKINFTEESKHISDIAINEVIFNINNNSKNAFLFQSPTGSGKTTAFKKILTSIKKFNYTILCIVTRRSMCSTLITAFNYTKNENGELIKNNEFNFASYLDKSIDNDDEFVSSLEHLFIFKQFYDVLILDEIFSLCSHLYSETLTGKRKDCLLHLKNLISNAKLIICGDARIADICFELLAGKQIYFYKNTSKNKLNIPFDIHVSSHSSDNSNLTKIAQIIGDTYCKNNKSVLVFSDRKNTTIKMHELLKNYNNNSDYFRVFNANCGTIEDINNIDTISKNRCLIFSPRVIYGVDITTQYDEIFCIYSKTHGTDSMSSFEWYQQLSRARICNKINVYILDPNVNKFYNSYISYDKHKDIENNHIDNYIYYTDKLYKKYDYINQLTSIDNFFRIIHSYKSWYDSIFSNNKLQILKLLAEQYGYIVTEINFDSVKVNSGLNKKVKLNYELLKQLSFQILNNENVDEQYKNYIPNLTEQLDNRKKYINDDEEKYFDILCDENIFKSYINKKILDLSKNDFEKKVIKINNQDLPEIMKDNDVLNKINALFWIESVLNIKRYDVHNINVNIDNTKQLFLNNIDKLFVIYDDGRSKSYINNRIKNIISKINSTNKLQKLYADILNIICNDVIKINVIKNYIKNLIIYIYDFEF